MRWPSATAYVLLWLLTAVLIVVWDQNLLSILSLALGVTAVLLVLFKLRWWRVIGVAAAALFLVNWGWAFVTTEGGGSPLDAYAAVVSGVSESDSVLGAGIVLAYEVGLPVAHLVTGIVLAAGGMKGGRE